LLYFIGYPFGGPMSLDLGYPPAGGFAGFGCSGIAALGAGGYGVFFPGAWVAI